MPCISVAFVVGGVGVAQSVEEPAGLEDSAAGIDRAADRAVAHRLARPLGMEARTLETQRAQTLLGWGDLVLANRLVQATGFSFTQIVNESQSGKSWEAIAEDHMVPIAASAARTPSGPAPHWRRRTGRWTRRATRRASAET